MTPNVYRNQTQAIEEIKRMQRIRITTKAEAVAFLRALAPLHEQVAGVLQRTSIAEQHAINRGRIEQAKEEVKEEPKVEPKPQEVYGFGETPKTLVPEDLSSDEGYSDKEVEEKVAKLKKANESSSKKKGN